MSRKKLLLGVAAALVGAPLLGAGGFYLWARGEAQARLDTTYEIHRVELPVPFPLTPEELAALGAADPAAGADPGAIALQRAVARGKHLVIARYACGECHGQTFAGGVMVDDPMVGTLLGPNLTLGKGSRTTAYTSADWDRIVRHGIRPDGKPSPMPSKDFFEMSDRELSDIICYIRSLPAVDAEVPRFTLGPLGTVLAATGALELSATIHPTGHAGAHLVEPPPEAPDAVFGGHIAQACTGCHRRDFSGGPIAGGPPDWPPAANLTPQGLAGWTFPDFQRALLEGKRRDGTALRSPMNEMPKFAANMTAVELQAMWAYLQTLPPTPLGH